MAWHNFIKCTQRNSNSKALVALESHKWNLEGPIIATCACSSRLLPGLCKRNVVKAGIPVPKFMMPPLPRVLGFVGTAWYTFYPILSLTGKRLWQSSRLRQQSPRSGNRNISCLLAYIAFHLNKTRCSMFRLPQFYIQYLRQPLDTLQIVYSRVSIPDLSV